MFGITLQSIGNSCYFSGDVVSCQLDQLVTAFGGPGLFGLVLGATIFTTMFIASEGDLATPTVALILTGTVTVAMLPARYAELAGAVVLIGLAAGVFAVLRRYSIEGVR